jgi:hypothetical protein
MFSLHYVNYTLSPTADLSDGRIAIIYLNTSLCKQDKGNKPWFKEQCKNLLKENKSRLIFFNSCKSHDLSMQRKKYKNYETKLKRKYKRHEGDMLDYLKKRNPNHFYSLFSKKKRRNVQNNLTNTDFYMHYRGISLN